jgi:hypothetical protein
MDERRNETQQEAEHTPEDTRPAWSVPGLKRIELKGAEFGVGLYSPADAYTYDS